MTQNAYRLRCIGHSRAAPYPHWLVCQDLFPAPCRHPFWKLHRNCRWERPPSHDRVPAV